MTQVSGQGGGGGACQFDPENFDISGASFNIDVSSLDLSSLTFDPAIDVDLSTLDASAITINQPAPDLSTLDASAITVNATIDVSTLDLSTVDASAITVNATIDVSTLDLSTADASAITVNNDLSSLDLSTLDLSTLDASAITVTGGGGGGGAAVSKSAAFTIVGTNDYIYTVALGATYDPAKTLVQVTGAHSSGSSVFREITSYWVDNQTIRLTIRNYRGDSYDMPSTHTMNLYLTEFA